MRVLLQRALNASVMVDSTVLGSITHGLVVYVGFTMGDTDADLKYCASKLVHLRIFDDENGVMNQSLLDVEGSVLSISQFTLYADTKKGRRPSYGHSLPAVEARKLYDQFHTVLRELVPVETGQFQAEMQVTYTNDGPVTILIDSKER